MTAASCRPTTCARRWEPECPNKAAWSSEPTDLLVLPHGGEAFALPDSKMATIQKPALTPRNHYGEFVDAVLAGPGTACSASFDYSGPLTESVLIGNVAAHYPGETLTFDAARLAFPAKPDANRHLSRSYRKGWKIKGADV